MERYLFEDELKSIFEVIDDLDDRALIEFAIETGLRASDMAGIITSNIDFKHQCVEVWDEKKDKWRTAVFPKRTSITLKMYLKKRSIISKLLFPMCEKTMSRKLKKYCVAANVKLTKRKTGLDTKVSWHWLRHTFIRRSQMVGRDIIVVQQNTGDTIATILRHYRGLVVEDRVKEMEKKDILAGVL